MNDPVLAAIRQAQFEAAWYLSVVVAAMLLLVFVATAWALRGALRIYRSGDRPAGALIAAAVITALLGLLGMFLAGAVGLVRTGGLG